jgi:hypothetical protein
MTRDRKALAHQIVTHLLELQLTAKYADAPAMLIHWDDCDMDYRRFWFHFKRFGLSNVCQTKTPEVRDCSKLIKNLKAEALKLMAPSIYECHWDTYEKPMMKYRQYDGRKTPEGYDTDTWIYVLSFYG